VVPSSTSAVCIFVFLCELGFCVVSIGLLYRDTAIETTAYTVIGYTISRSAKNSNWVELKVGQRSPMTMRAA